MRHPRHRRHASALAASVTLVLALAACSDSSSGPDDDGGGTDDPTISTLVEAPAPARLVARGGALYWRENSETPIARIVPPSGARSTVLAYLPSPERALPDGDVAFWVAGGRLYRTATTGGTTTLLDEGARDAASGVTSALATDAGSVYWANSVASGSCSPACTFTIRRVPKAGGAATVLATVTQPIVDLVLAGGYVYWEEELSGPASADGTVGSQIKRVPAAGGDVTVIVNGRLNGLIPPPGPGFIPGTWHPRGGIAVDDSMVYFGDANFFDAYRILRVPLAGGDVDVLLTRTTGSASQFARDLVLDAERVYWVDETAVRAMPLTGGTATEVAATLAPAVSLARVDQSLFWLETACCAHGQGGQVRTVGTAGGTPVTVQGSLEAPVAIAADPLQLLWIEGGAIGGIEGFGRLARSALDGTGPSVLVEAAAGGAYDVGATHVFFANGFTLKRVPVTGGRAERLHIGDGPIRDVATDGEHVYWLEEAGQVTVARMPVNGGDATLVSQGNGPAGLLRVDATHVYWLEGLGTIRRAPKAGGSAQAVVAGVAGGIADFVVHAGTVYYAEWDGGAIRKVAATGGTPATIVSLEPDQTRRIATDGEHLWWTDQRETARIPVTGGQKTVIASDLATDPFAAGSIAIDATALYWTEVAADLIRMAVPR